MKTFSVAPMLDWTDRHFRFLCRLISKEILLYTEMVATKSLVFGNRDYLLNYHEQEHPIALQLGGSDIQEMLFCGKLAQQKGYDQININVGCPSDRVQSGQFGACLMANAELIAEMVTKLQENVKIPVTIKCRTGIDHLDQYEFLTHFIQTIADAGCKTFIIHARKAWLSGLSPKQNRDIPPLEYDKVYQVKQDFPKLDIHINGGITSIEQAKQHLKYVDGVMLGRAVYQNPWILSQVDSQIFHKPAPLNNQKELVLNYLPYLLAQMQSGVKLHAITRHMLGLFHGLPGAKRWRRLLSEQANQIDNTRSAEKLILQALDQVVEES